MTVFEYLVNIFVYEVLILGCSAPVLVLFLRLFQFLAKGPAGNTSMTTAIGGLVWFFGGTWIAHNASRRHVFGGEGFFEAIGSAFMEARLLVSFLPVVGKVFSVRSPIRSPLDGPD